ncbi:hypothetical protein [Burkholderia sp. 22PA0106]|uniref:hypothetical protein n=1 Tax=Burkholderia sp. 22PA0106 TaxID=3237371 RepID=UPI0039C1B820
MAKFDLYNEDSSLQFSLSSRLCRYIGSIQVGNGSGQFTVPTRGGGPAWGYFTLLGSARLAQKQLRIYGNVLMWSVFTDDGSPVLLNYGEY